MKVFVQYKRAKKPDYINRAIETTSLSTLIETLLSDKDSGARSVTVNPNGPFQSRLITNFGYSAQEFDYYLVVNNV